MTFAFRPDPKFEWVKELKTVDPMATTPYHYEGKWLSADSYYQLEPGTIVLGKSRSGGDQGKEIHVYILLTPALSYLIKKTTKHGWASSLRHDCRYWMAMDATDRRVRACNLFIAEMQSIDKPNVTDNLILNNLRKLRLELQDDVKDLNEESVIRLFEAWLDFVTMSTDTDIDEVCHLLGKGLRLRAGLHPIHEDPTREFISSLESTQEVQRERFRRILL